MKTLGFALVLVIIAAFLAGCAGQAAPTPAALTPITLQLQWVTQAQFAGYYVALDKGWYKEEGLDVTIIPGGPDQSSVDLVSSGTRDFGTALLADLAVAVEAGKPVIGISQIQQKNGLLLIAKKTSAIQGPKDFVGKKIGLWTGSFEAQFNALMAQQGISSGQYSRVSQGYSMNAFTGDQLDVASAMTYNEYYSVLEAGYTPADLTIIDYANYGLDFPGDTLFTSKSTAQQNPDLCAKMVRASLRGWQYAIAHPDEAVSIVLKYDQTGVQTQPHQLSMMNEITKLVDVPGGQVGRSDATSLQRTINTLRQFGILKSNLQPADVITNQFWDQAQAK